MGDPREPQLAAWLATMHSAEADTARSIAAAPTLVPARTMPAGGQALAAFEHLDAAAMTSDKQLRQGATIGEGGMGVIRLAEQVALGRTVAVKTLKPVHFGDEEAALDLLLEAWVTGSIEHPNIVPVHYLGVDERGHPLIVLKRIEGTTWRETIGGAELGRDLGILLHVLDAVRFAHRRGIVHRDLKPANVMIGEFGEVYLLDWGIAVSLRESDRGRLPLAADATGSMAGTPCYMAPEMLGREGARVTEQTDVYLAGAVIYEILAGRPPHTGPTASELVAQVEASTPAMPPGAPPELWKICARAMAVTPADRHASIEALQHELRAFLEHRGSARLAAHAHERLDELTGVLAGACDRQEVYRLFGAARFGFHEAIAAWDDNADARAGLVRATAAVVAYELADDEPQAALALLGQLDDPPPALLALARDAAARKDARDAELAHLGREHDPTTGRATRSGLSAVMGLMFAALPLIGTRVDGVRHGHLVAITAALLALLLGLGWARRAVIGETLVNRRLFLCGAFMMIAQLVLVIGASILALPLALTYVLMIFSWFATVGVVCLTVDLGLIAPTLGFAAMFLIAAASPARALYAMTGGNVIFAANAVLRHPLLRWWRARRR